MFAPDCSTRSTLASSPRAARVRSVLPASAPRTGRAIPSVGPGGGGATLLSMAKLWERLNTRLQRSAAAPEPIGWHHLWTVSLALLLRGAVLFLGLTALRVVLKIVTWAWS